MMEPLDIFKKDIAGLIWIEAVRDLETAEVRVKELAARSPGEYVVFCQRESRVVETYRIDFSEPESEFI